MTLLGRLAGALRTLSLRFTTPVRIEFNLTDHCNLNCKGCTHYASIAPEEYANLQLLERNMRHLSTIRGAEGIKQIYLIGGEPLIYPWLHESIQLSRRYFPHAEISIFTNGLRLPHMDDRFWELCRENELHIVITRYPISFDYDSVIEMCTRQGVRFSIFGDRGLAGSFFKVRLDPLKRSNRWNSHFKCYSFGCLTVQGDKLFPCPQSACVEHLNRRFDQNFSWEKGDYLPIAEIKDIRAILRLRNRPVPFCSYCRKMLPTHYSRSSRVPEEWIEA
ncbi:MAG: radical SAM protein [Muribaculaceae bacterium]|nr:radical SAM protein [Muribaculaceae bacterium]